MRDRTCLLHPGSARMSGGRKLGLKLEDCTTTDGDWQRDDGDGGEVRCEEIGEGVKSGLVFWD